MTKSSGVRAVQKDVEDLVSGLDPGSASSKDVYSPLPSPTKTTTSKRTVSELTVKTEISENVDFDSDSSIEFVAPRKKKKKVPLSHEEDIFDDVEMTFCLDVETPPPRLLIISKKSATSKITTLGPYIFFSSLDYAGLLDIVADGFQTRTANLDFQSMKWKFDRPGNSKAKPLKNETGYKAMIKALVGAFTTGLSGLSNCFAGCAT
ncbi:hypothetical protein B0H14DRAFT_3779721 [Mycena olivaceomarginata]|nr:hypothetical protein B0H14DRAFT_3779721 [Mycena olivaceomarginata]